MDESIQVAVADLLRTYPRMAEEGKRRTRADPFVVALAQLEDYCVVSYESFSPTSRKPKIPKVCMDLDLDCVRLPELFAREGWTF